MVLLLTPRSATAELPTVAIDVRSIDDETFDDLGLLSLQQKLALRLAQAGFAVVAPTGAPRVLLLFETRGGQLRISATSAELPPVVQHVARGSTKLEGFHLEVIHKAIEAVRQIQQAWWPTPPRAPTSSRPTSRPTPTSRPASQPTSVPTEPPNDAAWHLAIGVGAGTMARIMDLDLRIDVVGRFGKRRGLGIRTLLTVLPPLDDAIDVVEWAVLVGVSYRLELLDGHTDLEAGLLGGFLNHRYSLADGSPSRGSQWDAIGQLFIELGWRPHRQLRLAIVAGAGLTEGQREHLLDSQQIWRRSAAFLSGGGRLFFVLR